MREPDVLLYVPREMNSAYFGGRHVMLRRSVIAFQQDTADQKSPQNMRLLLV